MRREGEVIIRVDHQTHYTVIRDKTIRDSRLSFKARGLLVYLLSLPDDTLLDRELLRAAGTDGAFAIRTALQELTGHGYIEHKLVQDKYGKWRTEAIVRERPKGQRTDGGKTAIGLSQPDGGKPATKRSTKEGTSAHASPPPSPPYKYQCAACGVEAEYMRRDETWWCEPHYREQEAADRRSTLQAVPS